MDGMTRPHLSLSVIWDGEWERLERPESGCYHECGGVVDQSTPDTRRTAVPAGISHGSPKPPG
jgi:hypothetical protein